MDAGRRIELEEARAAVGAAEGTAIGRVGGGRATAQPTHGTCATGVRRGRSAGHHVCCCWFLSGAPQTVWAWAATLVFSRFRRRYRRRKRCGGPGGEPGASVMEALDRGRRCGPVTYRS